MTPSRLVDFEPLGVVWSLHKFIYSVFRVFFVVFLDNTWGNQRWRRWDSAQERLWGEKGFKAVDGMLVLRYRWVGGRVTRVMMTVLIWLLQSLDYDRCINEPYVEVLEGMNNKVTRCVPVIVKRVCACCFCSNLWVKFEEKHIFSGFNPLLSCVKCGHRSFLTPNRKPESTRRCGGWWCSSSGSQWAW